MSEREQAPHSDFSGEWLALREAADHRARDRHQLLTRLVPWLAARGDSARILDLGCGSGSNLRYLSPRLAPRQQWWLLDQDAALLDAAAGASHAPQMAGLSCHRCDLVALQDALNRHAPPQPHLVTASALLDLVSEAWLKALAAWCKERDCALLLALSIDGHNRIAERGGSTAAMIERDNEVQQLIAHHQRRDKGFDGALGSDAPAVAQRRLRDHGFEVTAAAAPWRLDSREASQAALMQSLLAGWQEASLEQAPARGKALTSWLDDRRAAIEAGRLEVTVGHCDLLALPGESGL